MTFIASSAVCRVTIQSITHRLYMTCTDTLQIAAIRSKCSESATFKRECHLKEIEMKAETDNYYSECHTPTNALTIYNKFGFLHPIPHPDMHPISFTYQHVAFCGPLPSQPGLHLTRPYPVALRPNGSGYSSSQTFSRVHPIYQTQFIPQTPTRL
jgi:hypothetical protein